MDKIKNNWLVIAGALMIVLGLLLVFYGYTVYEKSTNYTKSNGLMYGGMVLGILGFAAIILRGRQVIKHDEMKAKLME